MKKMWIVDEKSSQPVDNVNKTGDKSISCRGFFTVKIQEIKPVGRRLIGNFHVRA